ncbi:MAG: class E sortase [Microbacteriaceae bacterium]|nr:class E sortase [Microbacteriaceae bacterium]
MPPRPDNSKFRPPRFDGQSPDLREPELILGRTYALREERVEKHITEFVPQTSRSRFVDFRGLGILVTRREFVDRAIGVSGETLVTAGLFVLLFLGWHVWFNDIVQGAAQDKAAALLSNTWTAVPTSAAEFDRATGTSDGAIADVPPPVVESPGNANSFATVLVPRFGPRFERTVAEGVDEEKVLNNRLTGVGHYSNTALLGQVGNFAVAGHRTTYGAPFGDVDKLRIGDRIYVETQDGWYIYRFRNLEYVYPSGVSVLNPVPQLQIDAKDRILTMTSCHPKLSAAERFIAYAIYESFVPRSNGTPMEIARKSLVNG